MKHRTDFYEMIEEQYSNMGKVKRNEGITDTVESESKVVESKNKHIESQEKIYFVLFAFMWILSHFV